MKTKIYILALLGLLSIIFFLFPKDVKSKQIDLIITSSTSTSPVKPQKALTATYTPLQYHLSLKSLIIAEFKEYPAMIKVVECESKFRQFKSPGVPLISPTKDVGIMQINQVHWKEAKKLGLDIFNSPEDNIKMGKRILKSQGIKAWTCYTKKQTYLEI